MGRPFHRYWAAAAISVLGSQFTLLALPLTAVALHASAAQVALLATAGTLPNALGVVAGVRVGRLPRRPTLLAADLGRALVLAGIAAAYAFGDLRLALLLPAAFGLGCLSVAFELGTQAYLPALVGRDRLVAANASLTATNAGAQAAGPALAGLLVSVAAAPFALLADAASFVVSAALLLTVRIPALVEARRPRATREAARRVVTHPYLGPLTAAQGLANLAIGIGWSVVVVFAVRTLGLSGAAVGAALAAGQAGGLLGAVAGRRVGARLGVGRALLASFGLFGPAALLVALAPRPAGIVFLAAGWALENVARGLYAVFAAAVRQAAVPLAEQTRLAGVTMTIAMTTFPLGTALGGLLAALVGARGALVAGAAVAFLPGVPIARSRVLALRSIEDVEAS